MNTKIPHLGIGWDFPPKFTRSTKGTVMVDNVEDIEKSLYTIITTKKGERVMRPDFGCNLTDELFEGVNSTKINAIKEHLKRAIILYESRIKVQDIRLDITSILKGELLILIDYVVKTTNARRNIVFPYYTKEATDI